MMHPLQSQWEKCVPASRSASAQIQCRRSYSPRRILGCRGVSDTLQQTVAAVSDGVDTVGVVGVRGSHPSKITTDRAPGDFLRK